MTLQKYTIEMEMEADIYNLALRMAQSRGYKDLGEMIAQTIKFSVVAAAVVSTDSDLALKTKQALDDIPVLGLAMKAEEKRRKKIDE